MEWIRVDIAGLTAACCLGQMLVLLKSRPSQAREVFCDIARITKVRMQRVQCGITAHSKKTMEILLICARYEYEYVRQNHSWGGNGPGDDEQPFYQ